MGLRKWGRIWAARAGGSFGEGDHVSERLGRRLRQVVNGSRDAYVEIDGDGRVAEWSAGAEALLGWRRDEVIGISVSAMLQPGDAASVRHSVDVLKWTSTLQPGRVVPDVFTVQLPLVTRDGSIVFAEARLFAVGNRSDFRVCAFLRPAETDEGEDREPVSIDVLFDRRTGLASRQVFERRLTNVLGAPESRMSFAVVVIELDRFTVIADALGAEHGDLLLREVAGRLRAVASRSRTPPLLAYRGGAQFLALLSAPEGRAEVEAERFAGRVRRALEAPMALGDGEVFLTASFGVCSSPQAGEVASALVSNAAMAAHESTRLGGGSVHAYDATMRTRLVERLTIESALHHALERGELSCAYQPVVEMATSSTVGVEALLRWHHPVLGSVEPDRFIPVAEESGLIVPIGAWVIQEACRQLARWRTRGLGSFGSIEVNLSGRQFDDPELVDLVSGALTDARLCAGSLICEITESTLMRDAESSLGVLHALKSVGVALAIDDFGTGYSSLSYLRHFPVDMLKIDKCFVQSMEEPETVKIVTAIVNLGHELGMLVVAEGVETARQAHQLRRLGCDLAQGMWYAPPLPAAEAARSQVIRREAQRRDATRR
jgi:diguanylate cyclase (GGDEF)-like protein/PAS domain S-box-containing protein